MPIYNHSQSVRYLAKRDPVIKKLIKQIQLQPLKARRNHFESLISSVISQQLSVKAARTIKKRFVDLFGKKFPVPAEVLAMSFERLRTSGLSGSKISYIKNIAETVESGAVDFKKLKKLSDEEIITELVKIKGIGRWSAEMFLIFSLNRPNVFSHGDLGLKNAVKKLYSIDPKLHSGKLNKLLDTWHPHASTASRYLWKSLEL